VLVTALVASACVYPFVATNPTHLAWASAAATLGAAVGLLALVVFLSVSLLTYNPADPMGELVRPLDSLYQQDVLVYPQLDHVMNACGRAGAIAADLLFNGLGFGAYYLVMSLAILTIL